MEESVKLLYVCGAGRSGSTILDRMLGQVEGFFSAGEIRVLWDRALAQHLLCGCGLPLDDCPVWGDIIRNSVGGDNSNGGDDVRNIRQSARTLATPLILLPGGRKLLRSMTLRHVDRIAAVYKAIVKQTGCRVIVDSSKVPAYSYLLSQVPGIELYVVHLVRDPRAVAYSWQKSKSRPDMRKVTGAPSEMTRFGLVTSSLIWAMENIASEMLWQRSERPYLRLSYEEFATHPKAALDSIFRLLGETPATTPFVSDSEVKLSVNHTVAGNPDRMSTGLVKLRVDDEWRARLAPMNRRLVEVLTFPVLHRYGYSVNGA
ncbi:MAG: sulfotransferase domain-containing protein [Candidatus Binatus sp.]|uniref:sulfotransferase domain-containing protein n=1 Tax=Candidatus Binatus sp. TaxID=2811406 RepID=UPI0027284974|nr:sulfotransferase domain-containing protein [Candidatus Binatus sp.]MDO8432778.1 sulfotransferase domain-containing protein [Candidatus Binatus sp.]